MTADNLEYQIARLSLKPGDVLVVKINKEISEDDTRLIGDAACSVANQFGVGCFVIHPHFDLAILSAEAAEGLINAETKP